MKEHPPFSQGQRSSLPQLCLLLVTWVSASTLLIPSPLAGADSPPPNILLIIVDDLRPTLGCYEDEQAISPHIDRLAEGGTLFERAYSNVPVCMPSRVSFLTSKRADRTMQRAAQLGREFITLPRYLKDHGYTTVSNGKVFHFIEDRAEDWTEPPWRSVPIYHGEMPWGTYNTYGLWQDPESAKLINPETGFGPFFDSADVPDDAYQDGLVAQKTISDLQRLGELGQPFFLACGFWRPHLPFNAPQRYWDLYDAEKLILAPNRFPIENLPDLVMNSPEFSEYAGIDGFPTSEAFHRKALHGYLACVSYVDAQVGLILDALDAQGLDQNTIVALIGDHGWHLGEHNFWGKHNTLNNALKAPFILRAPGHPEGIRSSALVEYLDLYPTLVELAGLALPDGLEGRSLTPLLNNPGQPWRESIVFYWNDRKLEDGKWRLVDAIAIKTDRFLYTEWRESGKIIDHMLFDHEQDPLESVNIADEPKSQPTIRHLHDLIEEFLTSSSFQRRERNIPGVTDNPAGPKNHQ
jgi:iduronate 2-sulfatase